MSDFTLHKKKQHITVEELFTANEAVFQTRLLSGRDCLGRFIDNQEVHFPGLALTGFLYHFHYNKIQFLSDMEWHYLESLSRRDRRTALRRLFQFPVPVIVITMGRPPHPELTELAEKAKVPIYQTPLASSDAQIRISGFLEDYFAPKITTHASLIDVYGIGLLYTGKSGIGKSECTLDLIERGHRLVADDVVTITHTRSGLIGTGSDLLGSHMEIRGIGIINIQSLFGIRAIRKSMKIEVVVELMHWDPTAGYERVGLSESTTEILGTTVDKVIIPIFPGKNITVISEVIAMNMLLKHSGVNTAKEFNDRLMQHLQSQQNEKITKRKKSGSSAAMPVS